MHKSILSAQLGKPKATEKILVKYYWCECRININNWTKSVMCAANFTRKGLLCDTSRETCQ